ncbi:peptide chain release factor 2 [endosymbiont of Euscepes postfasciatus]|uniref:peptide chain release factor-like protein n=1 Tax=endosymbiont of Euscepes postfasciatus TaxID=650377 RepID=UPI000DC71649|nr:peptide chain release factor-like protein [endosymbiont of Euscepes postfasciatus]BBA84545.1 peptide chain release factor 2 [endosymbiont of Euscepes postfasciatus]
MFEHFFKKDDENSCIVHIQSGSGGIDSRNWIVILSKMYIKWANLNKLNVNIKSSFSLESNKNKNIILEIDGMYSYGLFKTEKGIHKLIRKSPFNFWKRHTSFGSVDIYKKNAFNYEKIDNIDYKDIKISFCKSSGHGGQHINKTKSSVILKHIPTGIISKSQDTKSQNKNKNIAFNKLKYKLNKININNIENNKKFLYNLKSNISWSGDYKRFYIFDNSIIKDLKTGITTKNVKYILNGNIEIFVEKSLKLNI